MNRPLPLLLLSTLVVAVIAFVCFHWVDIPFLEATTITDPAQFARWEPITRLGLSGWYFAAMPILYILFRFLLRPPRLIAANRCVFIFCSILSTGLVVTALKPLLGRTRPALMKRDNYGYTPFEFGWDYASMPSGHAATIAALAACLWILFPRWRPLWIIGAGIIASSRMIIGSHFLSDVLVGVYIAVVMTIITLRTLERRGWNLGRHH